MNPHGIDATGCPLRLNTRVNRIRLGRTGTVLAAYFVTQGMTARAAIERVRQLRPNSVETDEQEEAVAEFARRQQRGDP